MGHHIDTRTILATNENLSQAVAEGRFRQDLYYRINVVSVQMPPLRERISDIPLLSKHFLIRYAKDSRRSIRGFSDEAMDMLQRYHWPGNIRELENVIERAVVLGKLELIHPSDLPEVLHRHLQMDSVGSNGGVLKDALQSPEKRIIQEALESHGWNRQETAEALGINRTTLYKKMKRLGVSREHIHSHN